MHTDQVRRRSSRRRVLTGALTASTVLASTVAGGAVTAIAANEATEGCPTGAICGSITVPVNVTHPEWGTTPVGYIWKRHTGGGLARSTIVPNPGGPGSATTVRVDEYLDLLRPLLDQHDVLLVDPRGTGRSGPLNCGLTELPTNRTDFVAAIGDCGKRLGSKARGYTSAAVTDDIEAVRTRLGVGRIDLLGQSYGAYLMTVYAQRHPEAVRSIVLSGASPLDFNVFAAPNAEAVRRALTLVCQRSAGACKGGKVLADLSTVANRAHRKPLSYKGIDGNDRLLDDTALAGLIAYGPSDDPARWGMLPAAITAAASGDDAKLLAMAAQAMPMSDQDTAPVPIQLPPGTYVEASLAVMCNDYPTAWDRSAPIWLRSLQFDVATALLPPKPFAPFRANAWARALGDRGDTCLRWPDRHPPRQPTRGRLPSVPTLVLQGDLDANTPTAEARITAARFPGATLVEVPNAGHVAERQVPCAAELEREFLRTGQVSATPCAAPPIPVR